MNARHLAPYVLRALFVAQRDGRLQSLDSLVAELHVRRADVRACVRSLHQEGCVDGLHMRLTMRGLALGAALVRVSLGPIRKPQLVETAARAA